MRTRCLPLLVVLATRSALAAPTAATEREVDVPMPDDPDTPMDIDAEGTLHAGIDFGWAGSTFAQGDTNGYGAGVHFGYGVSDAFNLRLHGDVTAFDLAASATSALVYHAGFGAEYVVDVLRWVPYVGLVTGPTVISYQHGEEVWHLGADIPIGLGYRLSRDLTVAAEVRVRFLLFGTETTPIGNLLGFGRFEYTLPTQ
jgi:hypothetical protein